MTQISLKFGIYLLADKIGIVLLLTVVVLVPSSTYTPIGVE
jgi:hypothetical protein